MGEIIRDSTGLRCSNGSEPIRFASDRLFFFESMGVANMKPIWIMMLLAALTLAGCGGGDNPVNKGLDRPVPPKKDKDK